MSILFDDTSKTITLHTRRTTYQMQLAPTGHLLHLYYGARSEGCFDYRLLPRDCGFSPNPYELRNDRAWSLDTLPQEYSGALCGDYRLVSVYPVAANGASGADLRHASHRIEPGKYTLDRLPAAFARDGEAETLTVTLRDAATGLRVELLYGVFAEADVIARAVRFTNDGDAPLRLEKAASVCLDLPFGDWELLHFHGRHCMERQPQRTPLMTGIQTVRSTRGMSSHQHNPFVILCDRETTEEHGLCYGVMPLWSGSHQTEVEVDQMGAARLVSGVCEEGFSWTLAPGETFEAPEALLVCTEDGLGDLSRRYHRFIFRNLCRSRFVGKPRPVLLNNWEATYFDFDADKLLALAREAKALGVDLLVLDDGWFGNRCDDNRALGDWFVNEAKLPGGLDPVIDAVNALGLKFGIWIEPEMVSEDSDLFRAHPDWALTVPNRAPTMGRNQLVLDMGRAEVVEYLYGVFSALLREHRIEYVKWDMNRSLSDVYSAALPPERQGEAAFRYVLGMYDLLRRLTEDFPDVRFEGCAGGGGRFDAGMLAFVPQIWCSDDSDAAERLTIQRGTSYGYPAASMGAHVSACPNHQTGRTVPLGTRAVAAMSGTFGYELDPARLTDAEKDEIRAQIRRFRALDALLQGGDYHRLAANERFTAWAIAAPDGSEALVSVVVTHTEANPRPLHLRLRGLDPDADYVLAEQAFFGCALPPGAESPGGADPARRYGGAQLLCGGWTLPALYGDYPSVQLHFKRV
jgi:alpha-galactosidase